MPLEQADIDKLAELLKPALNVPHENTKADVFSYTANGLLNVVILAVLGFISSKLPTQAMPITPVQPAAVVVPAPAPPVDPTAAALKDLLDGQAKINSRLDALEKKK